MRRRVTVDSTKSVRDSAESRRPSVFERLGPGAGRDHRDSSRQDKCRNWIRDGSCPYGDTCHFQHGPYSRGKDRLSDTEPPMDLRHRVESKRAERERHEREAWDDDRSDSPPAKEEKRRRSRRDKDGSEKKKKKKKREISSMVVKQDQSSSSSSDEGEAKDWRPQDEEQIWNTEDPDFEYVRELTLERRRQQLQRELEQMEMEENQSDRDQPIEDDNSTNDEKQKAASPPRKKHSKKKRSHSNSSKHERQTGGDEMEASTSKSSKSHKKHKHSMGGDASPRGEIEKPIEQHHGKKKSRKSKSPVAAKAHSPSPPPPVKMDDTPKKHKNKEGKKKDKAKKRKYQSDSSDDDDREDVGIKKHSSSASRKKSSSKRHISQSPKRSPSRSPQRRAKQRDPSPSSQSESSQASTRRGKSPASVSGSHVSESPKRSMKKKRYHSPSPPPKRSRQPTPEMRSTSQSRHPRKGGSPDDGRHPSRSISRGQSPSYKKRGRSTSIGSSQKSQSPTREHRRSPSPPTKKQSMSRGKGSSPGRDPRGESRDRGGQRRPPERMPPDGSRSKSGYDKYDNKRPYNQDRSRSSSAQMRGGRPPGRDGVPGRDGMGRGGYPPPNKDPGGRMPPGRNERVSRREDWEKKRDRDGGDPRDEPYSKRARSDTRGSSPQVPQKNRPYGRDDDQHSLDRQSGRFGSHSRSSSVVQQNIMSRQDRDRSGSRRPDYPSDSGQRGRDNTPDFRRTEHLRGEGQHGRDGTPDGRRGGDYRDDSKGRGRDPTPDGRRGDFRDEGSKGRGRDQTPDRRRQEYPSDVRRGKDGTPDKRYVDYHTDGSRKGRDGTPGDMRRSEHLEGNRKGRDDTPESRSDKRRGGEEPKGEGYGKYEDKRDSRKFEERGGKGESGKEQQREEVITRGNEGQRDSRTRDTSREPPQEQEQPPEPPQEPEVPPESVPKPMEQPIKREMLKNKTDSIESKVSSTASEAKGSPALEKKFPRGFSEQFSDWSDEGSDGLLTRSSTPLEQERLGNRQQRPSRAEVPAAVDTAKDLTGPGDVPMENSDKPDGATSQVESDPNGVPSDPGGMLKETEEQAASAGDIGAGTGEDQAAGGDAFQAEDAYEEISDDELDDILEGNEEDESQVPETKNMAEVDWTSMMQDIQPVATTESKEQVDKAQEEKVSILKKFSPANVLKRVGVSRALAGPALMKEIEALCRQQETEDDKETSRPAPLFEEQLGALNATANQRYEQRKHLFTNVGPCRRALCARRDIMIRKQLRKDKDTEQVFSNPVIDTELYRLSLQLFRTKRPSLVSPLESKDSGLMLKSISVTT